MARFCEQGTEVDDHVPSRTKRGPKPTRQILNNRRIKVKRKEWVISIFTQSRGPKLIHIPIEPTNNRQHKVVHKYKTNNSPRLWTIIFFLLGYWGRSMACAHRHRLFIFVVVLVSSIQSKMIAPRKIQVRATWSYLRLVPRHPWPVLA